MVVTRVIVCKSEKECILSEFNYGKEFKVPKRKESMEEKNLKYKKGIKVPKRKDGKEFKVPKRNKCTKKE